MRKIGAGWVPRFTALLALVLAAAACGGSGTNLPERVATAGGTALEQPCPGSGADAAGLDGLPAPVGVAPDTWQALTAALARSLRERQAVGGPAASGKQTCAPPLNPGSRAGLLYDVGTSILSWGYYNVGDYNQDGLVAINDLTPLGQHYGEESAYGAGYPFPTASLQSMIDGNGDGLLNIADVTAIGANVGARVDGYNIYVAGDAADYPPEPPAPNGPGAVRVETVLLGDAAASPGRRWFNLQVVPTAGDGYYWVRPFQGSAEGIASNRVDLLPPSGDPPTARLIYRGATRTLAHITWDAAQSRDADGIVVGYEWDLDGDDVFEYDTGLEPTADCYYYDPGTYAASVRITDNDGLTNVATLAVVIQEAASWQISVVEEPYTSVMLPSSRQTALLELDGRPTVFYCRSLESVHPPTGSWNGLACIRAEDELGEQWGEPQILIKDQRRWAVGIVAGRPAIAMKTPTTWISYARAYDAAGLSWPLLATVINTPAGTPLFGVRALLVLEGLPAILGDGDGYDICLRATDPFGATWSAPTTPPGGLEGIPLAVVGERLAEVTVSPESDLVYRSALDAAATGWSPAALIEHLTAPGDGMQLFSVAGTPALVYYDAARATLVYRRAMDSQGASWGPAMQLDKRADGYQLAAVVDGRPAVIYGDRLSGHVMFRAANDALGTRWAAPSGLAPYGDLILSLEDRASLWATCSFADVGGRPALTFISRPQLTHYLWLAMHK